MDIATTRGRIRAWVSSNFTTSPFYVFKGVYYFLRHRSLWPLLRARLIPLVLLSLCIIALLFITTYLPQVAILMIFHGRGSAWVNGTFLVLSEANLIIAIIFEAFLVDSVQVDAFDSVLVMQGHADLVRTRRPVADETANPLQSLGPRERGAMFAPFSFRQIVEFVILLPLNLVPYAGVPLFLLLTGYRAGPLLQYRYHVLKGMNRKERRAFIKQKSMRFQYLWFGTFYLMLQLIPILSMLFLITGAVSSALWAADMESKLQQRPSDQGQEETADQPPAYDDYADEP